MAEASEWLFNAPWWLLAAAGAVAVGFLLYALARTDKRLTRAAIGAIVLAALWAILTLTVSTPLEQSRARTVGLVEAYEARDWTRFGSLLDEETRFNNQLKGQEITEAAQLTHENLRTGSIRITDVEERRDGAAILIDVRIISEMESAYRSVPTAWRFSFHERGSGWKLEHIDPMPTEQVDLPTILQHVRFPRSGNEP